MNLPESQNSVSISYQDRTFEADLVMPTEGNVGISTAALRSETGLVNYDPGFASVASCKSSITYLNGEDGILRFRGYDIADLAENATFMEVAYLLLNKRLPKVHELREFNNSVTGKALLPEDMKFFFDAFPKKAHPMAILSGAVSALSTFYEEDLDPKNPEHVKISSERLMAYLPVIAAWSYKKSINQAYNYPRADLGYSENFLHMMFARKDRDYVVNKEIAKALDLLYILHADHEQNCSTTTVRLVGSSHANIFASIACGINALWGPLHGGANQMVVEMLEEIRDSGTTTQHWVRRAKDRNDPFRLFGFGHRVYREYDPRARIIKQAADEVLRQTAPDDPLFEIAQELEETALNDDFFKERSLYPNVDFYTGLIYRSIGLPLSMFPVMFAIGRLPGWIAQWKESHEDPDTRIGRPRQIYIGPTERPVIPLELR